MRNIHLHGHLGDRFGKLHRLEVATASEAVRAMIINHPEFGETLKSGNYAVVRGDLSDGLDLDLENLDEMPLGRSDLHILPELEGRKERGGMLKVIAGVALIGAAVFAAPAAGGLAASIGATGITYGNVAALGLALALSGVSLMLTKPTKDKSQESTDSFTLQGPSNTYGQGGVVPLIYGEVITGGRLISSAIDIEDIGAYQG